MRVEDGPLVEQDEGHLGAPAQAASLVIAGVHDEPAEPGVEAIRVPQLRELPPGPDERLLRRVLRPVRVPEDEAGQGVEPVGRGADERGERIVVAAHRQQHVRRAHVGCVRLSVRLLPPAPARRERPRVWFPR